MSSNLAALIMVIAICGSTGAVACALANHDHPYLAFWLTLLIIGSLSVQTK